MLPSQQEVKWTDGVKSPLKSENDEGCPSLGWRRNVLLVEASNSPDSGRIVHHARSLETCCSFGIKVVTVTGILNSPKPFSSTSVSSPFLHPCLLEVFHQALFCAVQILVRVGRVDLVPPLSLDGNQPSKVTSPPAKSPSGPRHLSLPVQSSPQGGIVHLSLQSDTAGAILRWRHGGGGGRRRGERGAIRRWRERGEQGDGKNVGQQGSGENAGQQGGVENAKRMVGRMVKEMVGMMMTRRTTILKIQYYLQFVMRSNGTYGSGDEEEEMIEGITSYRQFPNRIN